MMSELTLPKLELGDRHVYVLRDDMRTTINDWEGNKIGNFGGGTWEFCLFRVDGEPGIRVNKLL